MANADLPLAVGPAMMATGGNVVIIATLIAEGRLDRDGLFKIADRLEVPLGTVKSRINHGRSALRVLLTAP